MIPKFVIRNWSLRLCRFYILTLFFLSSCYNDDNTGGVFDRRNLNNRAQGKAYQHKIHLQPGSVYRSTFSTKSKITIEVDGDRVPIETNATIIINFEVLSSDTNFSSVRVRYEKLRISTKTRADETISDADNELDAFDSVDKILAYIKSSTFVLHLDSLGRVSNASGLKEMSDKVLNSLQTFSADAKDNAVKLVSELGGPAFVEGKIGRIFPSLPITPLYLDKKWSVTDTVKMLTETTIVSEFQVTSRSKSQIWIATEGKLSSAKNASLNLSGQELTAELQGHQTRKFDVNTTSGIVNQDEERAKLHGVIFLGGREIPVDVALSQDIETVKMK